MSPISISFSSPSVPKFAWFESHERLTIPELNELIIQCRGATAAFSTELNDRYGTSSKDDELQIHYQRLEQTAKQINHDGTFKPYEISIHNLCDVLDDPSGAHAERTPSKLARHFLWLVSRVLGWAHALLIFYALGRETIRKLNEAQRAKIIVYVVKHEDLLFCQPLDNQASACNLAQIRMVPLLNLPVCSALSAYRHQREPSKPKA